MATYDLVSTSPSRLAIGDILNCPYSGSMKSIELPKGTYKLEVWGAEGGGQRLSGNSNSGYGGKGGYSVGILTLSEPNVLYIYSGGAGSSTNTTLAEGGFNGGGCAWGSSSSEPGNGGGGGSDIRIGQDSLYARVIVAGGGGGGGEDPGDYVSHGGGFQATSSSDGAAYPGTATGSSGGGAFGQGAHTPNDGGGGGGGWYGGGTINGSQTRPTSNSSSDTSGGSGGSGYVYTSSTYSQYPSGCLLDSSMYLTDAQTINGNNSIPSTSGSTETGHTGNGYARITILDIKTISNYVKINGVWKPIDKILFKLNGEWIS